MVFVICYCRGNVSHTITLQSNQKEISTTEFSKPSMKFWAVGVFGLIWSFTGCYNYIIQADPEVLAQFPEAYWVVINSRPGWVSSSFVIAPSLASILAGSGGNHASSAMGDRIRTGGWLNCLGHLYVAGCCGLFGLVHTPQSRATFAALICCIKV